MGTIASSPFGYKTSKPPASLPQSGVGDLFVVSGGRVMVALLLGVVTSTVQSGVTNNARFHLHPDVEGGPHYISDPTSIEGHPAGRYWALSASVSNTLRWGTGRFDSSAMPQYPGWLVGSGVIGLECSGSATGAASWDVWWHPLDAGASVAAA